MDAKLNPNRDINNIYIHFMPIAECPFVIRVAETKQIAQLVALFVF